MLTRAEGFTLVEMLVTLTVMALLLAIGVPSFSNWLQNIQVRSVAESIMTGMQFARAEAVRQNVRVKFSLNAPSSNPTGDWSIYAATTINPSTFNTLLQKASGNETAKNARIGVSTASTQNYSTAVGPGSGMPASVTFSPLGRVVNPGTDITRVDVNNAAQTAARMVIIVSPEGQVRLCDPSLSLSTNPRGCQ